MSVKDRVIGQLYGFPDEEPRFRILRQQSGELEGIKSALIEIAIGIDSIIEQPKV